MKVLNVFVSFIESVEKSSSAVYKARLLVETPGGLIPFCVYTQSPPSVGGAENQSILSLPSVEPRVFITSNRPSAIFVSVLRVRLRS